MANGLHYAKPTCTKHYWTVATSARWAKAAKTHTFAWTQGYKTPFVCYILDAMVLNHLKYHSCTMLF